MSAVREASGEHGCKFRRGEKCDKNETTKHCVQNPVGVDTLGIGRNFLIRFISCAAFRMKLDRTPSTHLHTCSFRWLLFSGLKTLGGVLNRMDRFKHQDQILDAVHSGELQLHFSFELSYFVFIAFSCREIERVRAFSSVQWRLRYETIDMPYERPKWLQVLTYASREMCSGKEWNLFEASQSGGQSSGT